MSKPMHACRWLQNKAYFFAAISPAGGAAGAGEIEKVDPAPLSTPFWCLKTGDPIGPDGGDVRDACCGPHRPCYKPQVEL